MSLSLWQRIGDALPGVSEPELQKPGTCTSSDWFCGKMDDEWFQKHLLEIDHSDDRARRDWSKKDSEVNKGPNRFAAQWKEYVEGKPYTHPEDLPYKPDCDFGLNVSSSSEFERQRYLTLVYCELLRSYTEVWTKIKGRHPVAAVLFSGAGIMVRGFLWMGVRCAMIDYEDQKDAPIGEDCLFVRADVKKLDASKLEVDWVQASPPCPPTSTAPNMGGVASTEEQLIPFFQEMMAELNSSRLSRDLHVRCC